MLTELEMLGGRHAMLVAGPLAHRTMLFRDGFSAFSSQTSGCASDVEVGLEGVVEKGR